MVSWFHQTELTTVERTGVFFQNASLDRQYVIYVSRENLSLAQAVTGLEAKR